MNYTEMTIKLEAVRSEIGLHLPWRVDMFGDLKIVTDRLVKANEPFDLFEQIHRVSELFAYARRHKLGYYTMENYLAFNHIRNWHLNNG